MSREQAQEFLIKLYEQMMLRETMYRHFLKHQWGLEPNPGLELKLSRSGRPPSLTLFPYVERSWG